MCAARYALNRIVKGARGDKAWKTGHMNEEKVILPTIAFSKRSEAKDESLKKKASSAKCTSGNV